MPAGPDDEHTGGGEPAPPAPRRRGRSLSGRTRVLIGVATVGFIIVAGIIGAFTRPANSDRITPAGAAPAFSLPAVAAVAGAGSGTVSLADAAGHPVVLNFFGSWCPPCRQELPLLAGASRGDTGGVRFIGVDLEDSRPGAQKLLAQAGVTYPTGFDPGDTVATRYRLTGTPTTVFIDRHGTIVGRVEGPLTRPRLDWWLRQLRLRG